MPLPQTVHEYLPTADPDHCRVPFWPHSFAVVGTPSLCYPTGNGPWLERLCYRLGWRGQHTMRYFGRNGQAQFGVDLVGTLPDGKWAVWQCKNLDHPPTVGDVQKWLSKFEQEWLEDKKLPVPQEVFICCTQPMQDVRADAAWQGEVDRCRALGLTLTLWDKPALDEMLKSAPDLVADLFGDAQAEVFCGPDLWRRAPWFQPLSFDGQAFPPRLKRYARALKATQGAQIYKDALRQEQLQQLCRDKHQVLVRGEPGAGKTFEVLNLCRLWSTQGWRSYYLNWQDLSAHASPQDIAHAMVQRLSLPTLFLLDDCHGWEQALSALVHCLGGHGQHPNLRVIALMRRAHAPADDERSDDEPDGWVEDLIEAQAVLDWRVDEAFVRRYTEHRLPEWLGLSPKRLATLCSLTGKSLLLLDEFLATHPPLSVLDGATGRDDLLRKFRTNYVQAMPAEQRSALWQLAGLAQYELSVPDRWLSVPELPLLEGFWVRAGHPPRVFFSHSAAAELCFHALHEGHEVVQDLANQLQAFFMHQFETAGAAPARLVPCLAQLRQVMSTRPVLLTALQHQQLMGLCLSADRFLPTWLSAAVLVGDRALPSVAVHRLMQAGQTEAARTVVDALDAWLWDLLAKSERSGQSLFAMKSAMNALSKHAPDLWQLLCEPSVAPQWLKLIEINGTVIELFHFLAKASPELAKALMQGLKDDPPRMLRLLAKTRSSGRSIGTLNFTLLALGKSDPDVLKALEEMLPVPTLLDLIEANGTVFELFRFLEGASPEFAKALLQGLKDDSSRMQRLLVKTRSSGRSIGTLGLTLFELGKSAPDALKALEEMLPVPTLLDLIEANGTVFELFKFLASASPEFAKALLQGMKDDPPRMQRLLVKTRSSGRSIGTLGLTLFELGKSAPDALKALEEMLPVPDLLDLIESNGTVFELFRFLSSASPEFAMAMLKGLKDDPPRMQRLLAKTRSSERSIGTFNLTLRDLRIKGMQIDEGEALRCALEQLVGVDGFVGLMLDCGSLGAWVDLLDHFSAEFGETVWVGLVGAPENAWQVAVGRSSFFECMQFLCGPCRVRPLAGGPARPALSGHVEGAWRAAHDKVQSADWYALQTGLNVLKKAGVDLQRRRQSIDMGVVQRLQQVEANDLPDTQDWTALSHAVQLLNDYAPERMQDVVPVVCAAFAQLPNCRDEYMPAQVGGLLFALRHGAFSDEQVRACLAVARGLQERMCKEDPVKRLLWLWNLVAVQWERCWPGTDAPTARRRLRQWLGPAWGADLLEAWHEDAVAASKAHQVQQVLSLGGLLNWLGLDLPPIGWHWSSLRAWGFTSSLKATRRPDLGFMPAYFLQWGAGCVLGDRHAFSPEADGVLRDKLKLYGDLTGPVKALADTLR